MREDLVDVENAGRGNPTREQRLDGVVALALGAPRRELLVDSVVMIAPRARPLELVSGKRWIP